MKVTLTINKSIPENAAFYYEQAKKAKRKTTGAKEAIEKTKKEIEKLKTTKKYQEKKKQEKKEIKIQKKEWYEKFHWFISSDNFLCIGGKDATSNDIIVKKHVEKNDLVFHTQMPGSPFFIIKANNKKIPKQTKEETAIATASYSKSWKLGLGTSEVFSFTKEQIGENPNKGAFVIHGKRTYYNVELKLAIGNKNKIIGGPVDSIKKQTKEYMVIIPGHEKSSDIAKKIQHKLSGNLEEIQKFLPGGKTAISKQKPF